MLWFLTAPIMSATITELRDSKYTRWRNINVTQLEVATVRERGEERECVYMFLCVDSGYTLEPLSNQDIIESD